MLLCPFDPDMLVARIAEGANNLQQYFCIQRSQPTSASLVLKDKKKKKASTLRMEYQLRIFNVVEKYPLGNMFNVVGVGSVSQKFRNAKYSISFPIIF